MRVVLLCGIAKPPKLTPAERNKRYRERHPERLQARQRKFLANNPNYRREYYLRMGK